MFDQTFALSDLPRVLILIFLEILLSADNAIVLGVLAHSLPEHQRKKALYIGAISAIFLRAAAILCIAFLFEYRGIQLLGALYLLYLSVRHFTKKKRPLPSAAATFWKTVLLIELFDLAFAIDSIVAGVAFISTAAPSTFESKIWIVYIGGIIGLLAIRYAAHLFSLLLGRFPRLETSAYLIIGWIGLKLVYTTFPGLPSLEPLFWSVLILLFLLGLRRPARQP